MASTISTSLPDRLLIDQSKEKAGRLVGFFFAFFCADELLPGTPAGGMRLSVRAKRRE
jgi:hypothetical protein